MLKVSLGFRIDMFRAKSIVYYMLNVSWGFRIGMCRAKSTVDYILNLISNDGDIQSFTLPNIIRFFGNWIVDVDVDVDVDSENIC